MPGCRQLAIATLLSLLAPAMFAVSAQAQDIVDAKRLERDITQGFRQQVKMTVNVTCPKRTSWVKGSVFYCKVTMDGAKGRVEVTILSRAAKGHLKVELVP